MTDSCVYYFDVGNTRLKLWACKGGDLVAEAGVAHAGDLAGCLSALPPGFQGQPAAVLGASVLSAEQQVQFDTACRAAWGCAPSYAVSQAEQCGIRNAYGANAVRLGIDRWLAMLGVERERLGVNGVACVADCGTAVTVDLLSAEGIHLGGYILPGMNMMGQALRAHTARVRYEEEAVDGLAPGMDTGEAVTRGAALAVVSSLERVVRQYKATLMLTGGDARRIGRLLDVPYCDEPHLLLKGLQRYYADAGIS